MPSLQLEGWKKDLKESQYLFTASKVAGRDRIRKQKKEMGFSLEMQGIPLGRLIEATPTENAWNATTTSTILFTFIKMGYPQPI